MKIFLMLFVIITLAFGCNKEKASNRKLKGEWKVDLSYTHWQNGYPSAPQSDIIPNWGTLKFDKNGEGTLKGNDPLSQPFKALHFMDGRERIELINSNGVPSIVYYVTWGWDKKSFQMTDRGMHYGTPSQPSESYLEEILICTKK